MDNCDTDICYFENALGRIGIQKGYTQTLLTVLRATF